MGQLDEPKASSSMRHLPRRIVPCGGIDDFGLASPAGDFAAADLRALWDGRVRDEWPIDSGRVAPSALARGAGG